MIEPLFMPTSKPTINTIHQKPPDKQAYFTMLLLILAGHWLSLIGQWLNLEDYQG